MSGLDLLRVIYCCQIVISNLVASPKRFTTPQPTTLVVVISQANTILNFCSEMIQLFVYKFLHNSKKCIRLQITVFMRVLLLASSLFTSFDTPLLRKGNYLL